MLRKDKRSLALSLILGDGCLHIYKGKYGILTIDHGIAQADYQSWKAELLSEIFDRNVKVRTGHKGKSVQVSVCENRMRAWRKFTYPNGKKDLARILPFIRHPEMAAAIWLMDDGYVEPSRMKDGVTDSARFRIFTCDQSEETQKTILQWFKDNFQIEGKVKYQFKRSTNTHYPFVKWGQADSLKLWSVVREFVLRFKSMRNKFRHIEHVYQLRVVQRTPGQSG